MAADRPTDDAAEALGQRIREFRKLRGMSLRGLGEATQTTSGFLSQFERGATNASVSTLRRISTALGLTIADLFDDSGRGSSRLLRRADRSRLHAADGLEKYLISQRPLRHLEVYAGVLDPGASTGAGPLAHGHSQEIVLVVQGDVVVELDDIEHQMHFGDSIEYESSTPHRVINRTDAAAEVLWIISPPSNDRRPGDHDTTNATSPGGNQ